MAPHLSRDFTRAILNALVDTAKHEKSHRMPPPVGVVRDAYTFESYVDAIDAQMNGLMSREEKRFLERVLLELE